MDKLNLPKNMNEFGPASVYNTVFTQHIAKEKKENLDGRIFQPSRFLPLVSSKRGRPSHCVNDIIRSSAHADILLKPLPPTLTNTTLNVVPNNQKEYLSPLSSSQTHEQPYFPDKELPEKLKESSRKHRISKKLKVLSIIERYSKLYYKIQNQQNELASLKEEIILLMALEDQLSQADVHYNDP